MRGALAAIAFGFMLGALLGVVPASAQPSSGCRPGQSPTYVFGFAALYEWLGDATMGAPVTCEYADPNGTGDTEQNTVLGLAFWRKSTNTPTFTNGAEHWALTERGRLTWSGPSIDPPADARIWTWTPSVRSKTDGCVSVGGLPDPQCTPGALNPAVTPATLAVTICRSGYTATVRPPTSYTTPLERAQLAAYGEPSASPAAFELDHLIALELGGAPRDVANLWPEPYTGTVNARQKDIVENYLHDEVCRGTLPLDEAQRQIATDWLEVYHRIRP